MEETMMCSCLIIQMVWAIEKEIIEKQKHNEDGF